MADLSVRHSTVEIGWVPSLSLALCFLAQVQGEAEVSSLVESLPASVWHPVVRRGSYLLQEKAGPQLYLPRDSKISLVIVGPRSLLSPSHCPSV